MKVQVSSRRSRRSGLHASRELPRRTNEAKRQSPVVVVGGKTAAQTKPILDSPAGIRGRLCKTNPIRAISRRDPGASGTNKANFRRRGPGSARRAMLPVGPLVRNEANSGQCRTGWGWGPARRFSSRPLPLWPLAFSDAGRTNEANLSRGKSQSPRPEQGLRDNRGATPSSTNKANPRRHRTERGRLPSRFTNEANFRLDSYRPRPSKDPRRERMRWGIRKRLAASLQSGAGRCKQSQSAAGHSPASETPSLRPWGPGPGRTQSLSVAPPGMSLRAQRSNLPC